MTSAENRPLAIVGAGGHSRVISDIARLLGRVVATFVDEQKAPTEVNSIPVLMKTIRMLTNAPENYEYLVAIGDNFARARVVASLEEALPGIRFATLVHPDATIARNCHLGNGTIVMAGAIINPGSRIGKHCIVNTRASIDHDNDFGDFASIAPGAVTGGNVWVGDYSAISLGASVIHGVTIGTHSIVGAGAVVTKDVPEFSIVIGVPARVLRKRSAGESYL